MDVTVAPEQGSLDQLHAGFVSRAIAFILDLAIM